MKIVAFKKSRAGPFGEQGGHGGLAAAGHAHENQNARTSVTLDPIGGEMCHVSSVMYQVSGVMYQVSGVKSWKE
jgi:hypothetical protein